MTPKSDERLSADDIRLIRDKRVYDHDDVVMLCDMALSALQETAPDCYQCGGSGWVRNNGPERRCPTCQPATATQDERQRCVRCGQVMPLSGAKPSEHCVSCAQQVANEALAAPSAGEPEDDPSVIGAIGAVPTPTISDAVRSIADYLATDPVEESQHSAIVLNQAAKHIDALAADLARVRQQNRWPNDFETGMQHAYEVIARQPDLAAASRALADEINESACHPHEHECPTCGMTRKPLLAAEQAREAAEQTLHEVHARLKTIEATIDAAGNQGTK